MSAASAGYAVGSTSSDGSPPRPFSGRAFEWTKLSPDFAEVDVRSARDESLLLATLAAIASGCARKDAEPDGPSATCDDHDYSWDGIQSVELDVSEGSLPSHNRVHANVLAPDTAGALRQLTEQTRCVSTADLCLLFSLEEGGDRPVREPH